MIEAFTVSQFGCVRNASAALTPLHAFIGPNDSGKSTLLQALQWAAGWRTEHTVPSRSELGSRVDLEVTSGARRGAYRTSIFDGRTIRRVTSEPATAGPSGFVADLAQYSLADAVGQAEVVRFDPDGLRQPSPLLPRRQLSSFVSSRGVGLPAVLMDLRGRPDDLSARIDQRFKRRFPYVKGISLPATEDNRVALELVTTDGKSLSASQLSEGLLYYLAFEALRHIEDVNLLLVEEPENGLHPARIADVVKVLREISESGTQVVMATHSPLVVNELAAEEVTLVTRPSVEEGTKLTPMRETRNFEQRSKVYALGELWLAYADGETEQLLISDGTPEEDAAQ